MGSNAYDVVIVGGGLAGLSVAVALSQRCPAAIAVVEGRGVGSNNPTPLTFVEVVEGFDLEEHVVARYRRFGFHSPLGSRSSHTYDTPQLVALDYGGACDVLLRRARATGRVELLSTRAVDLARTRGGGWRLGLASGVEITAPLLVEASGRALFVTRKLGLPRPRMFSHCMGQVFRGEPLPDPTEALFLAPADRYGDGGGWFYPLAGGRASFGYATLSASAEYPGQLLKERYARAVQEFAPYATWLSSAEPLHVEAGSIPICPARRFVYDGLLLVGDAAGQATSWSCMGTEPALSCGQRAGWAAAEAYQRGVFSRAALASYQRWWDQEQRPVYRQGTLLAPAVWGQCEESWNRQVALVQQLTPEQMVLRLRVNWPFLPWWRVAFIRAYHLAGRVRRGLVARLGGKPGRVGGVDGRMRDLERA